ncbi:MAG: UDP-N-acetylmuramoyl-tripeptide--D-alanyl-D-alanine ligase [Abitibacteriaceae bacterium]|nr:UDP-N-acetylmuramoyl-tripeptide--D-alanyl-D-alanine ligase [Abditibacteriaceae bacterium]
MSGEQQAINHARFTLGEVAAACGGEIVETGVNCAAALEICGVSSDTRTLTAGTLFVALRGEHFDGHNFLEQAAAQGACAAVVESVEGAPPQLKLVRVPNTLHAFGDLARAHRRKFTIPVVGVTGSYGKTTTRALVAAVFAARFNVLASTANFNNEVGVPQTLFQLEEAHGAAVIEMGMRGAGQIDYLARIAEPTVGVITNIGPQHIELLGSLENIAQAKAELLHSLPSDGVAVLPADDDFLELMREQAPCRVVTFGESPNADYRVTAITPEASGNISFSLIQNLKLAIQNLKLPLPGEHNAINAAAALAVADVLGVPLAEAAQALHHATVPGGRMRVVQGNGITIIDDSYNAGPNSMRAALQTLLNFPGGGRRVAILGAMKELGDWAEGEHRKVGDYVGTFADVIIGVGGETRPLLNSALHVAATLELQPEVAWCDNAATAAQRAPELVQAGDVVLVKGSRTVGLETVVKALGGE